MDQLQRYCTNQIRECERIISEAEKFLAIAPLGSLHVLDKKSNAQFYWRTEAKDKSGKYIKKSDIAIARKLAQKGYAQKILITAKATLSKLRFFQNGYKPEETEDVYRNLSRSRQKLVKPYIPTEETYVEEWLKKKGKDKEKGLKEMKQSLIFESDIQTDQGEFVRSKSEKILADKFFSKGIPYAYEVPVFLKGYGYVRPDFVLLNKRTRKEYLFEHFGIMDDKEYCEKTIKKLKCYEKNGIMPGRDLLFSFETEAQTLNMESVELRIKEYLL